MSAGKPQPYERSASTYDAIYEAMKDYAAESERVRDFLTRFTRSKGNTVLDLACGTGLHDAHLVKWYDVEGLDLSEDQLGIARRRLPQVKFHQGDMVSFDLGKSFDAVICLFSSIGYLTNLREMRRGISCMARHLKPGGVLLVEPWLSPDTWKPDQVGAAFVDEPELKIARINTSDLKGRVTTLKMHSLVGRPTGVEYFVEHHALALYTDDDYLDAFRRAGLSAWRDADGLMGRGLFIGRAD